MNININDLKEEAIRQREMVHMLCNMNNKYTQKYDIEKAKEDAIMSLAHLKCSIRKVKEYQSEQHQQLRIQLKKELPQEILDAMSIKQLKECINAMNDETLTDDERNIVYMLISNY